MSRLMVAVGRVLLLWRRGGLTSAELAKEEGLKERAMRLWLLRAESAGLVRPEPVRHPEATARAVLVWHPTDAALETVGIDGSAPRGGPIGLSPEGELGTPGDGCRMGDG